MATKAKAGEWYRIDGTVEYSLCSRIGRLKLPVCSGFNCVKWRVRVIVHRHRHRTRLSVCLTTASSILLVRRNKACKRRSALDELAAITYTASLRSTYPKLINQVQKRVDRELRRKRKGLDEKHGKHGFDRFPDERSYRIVCNREQNVILHHHHPVFPFPWYKVTPMVCRVRAVHGGQVVDRV